MSKNFQENLRKILMSMETVRPKIKIKRPGVTVTPPRINKKSDKRTSNTNLSFISKSTNNKVMRNAQPKAASTTMYHHSRKNK